MVIASASFEKAVWKIFKRLSRLMV